MEKQRYTLYCNLSKFRKTWKLTKSKIRHCRLCFPCKLYCWQLILVNFVFLKTPYNLEILLCTNKPANKSETKFSKMHTKNCSQWSKVVLCTFHKRGLRHFCALVEQNRNKDAVSFRMPCQCQLYHFWLIVSYTQGTVSESSLNPSSTASPPGTQHCSMTTQDMIARYRLEFLEAQPSKFLHSWVQVWLLLILHVTRHTKLLWWSDPVILYCFLLCIPFSFLAIQLLGEIPSAYPFPRAHILGSERVHLQFRLHLLWCQEAHIHNKEAKNVAPTTCSWLKHYYITT